MPFPGPQLTQLGALLWGDGFLTVGLVGHRASNTAFAPPLAVGGFAAFGGHCLLFIVVLPRRVVRLVPKGQRRRQGWLHLNQETRRQLQETCVSLARRALAGNHLPGSLITGRGSEAGRCVQRHFIYQKGGAS